MARDDLVLPEGETFFPAVLLDAAGRVLEAAREAGVRLATAETVTAGLVSACLTSVSGASQIFDRGAVLYHESAKATGLGVPAAVSKQHGAVSAEVTRGLAEGMLDQSGAGVTLAVTGYAGPGGGTEKNPVGTIYLAAARRGSPTLEARHRFEGGRDSVRLQAVQAALDLMLRRLQA